MGLELIEVKTVKVDGVVSLQKTVAIRCKSYPALLDFRLTANLSLLIASKCKLKGSFFDVVSTVPCRLPVKIRCLHGSTTYTYAVYFYTVSTILMNLS